MQIISIYFKATVSAITLRLDLVTQFTAKAKFHYAIQVADLVADLVSDVSQTGSSYLDTVSYTHLTLPTNREV